MICTIQLTLLAHMLEKTYWYHTPDGYTPSWKNSTKIIKQTMLTGWSLQHICQFCHCSRTSFSRALRCEAAEFGPIEIPALLLFPVTGADVIPANLEVYDPVLAWFSVPCYVAQYRRQRHPTPGAENPPKLRLKTKNPVRPHSQNSPPFSESLVHGLIFCGKSLIGPWL